jgi:hypothetical protein
VDPRPVFSSNDAIFLPDGTLLKTHPESTCQGNNCCIHSPSDHPLREAPQLWNPRFKTVYRMCVHGHVHPDFDDFVFKARSGVSHSLLALIGAHDCDGCCHWPTRDQDD